MPDYPSTAADPFEKRSMKGRPNGYAGIDAFGNIIGVVGGGTTGPAGPAGPAGAPWTPVQSGSAPVVASGNTINTSALLTVSRVAPSSDVTSMILAPGTVGGQQIAVLNESAYVITFAPAITSHVSIGANCSITGQVFLQFLWDSVTGMWYPAAVGSTSTPPTTGTFGDSTFGGPTFGGSPPLTSTYGAGTYGAGTYSG